MSIDTPETDGERRFFDSAEGLYTQTRIRSTHGTSPVRVETVDESGGMVQVEICLSGGEVTATLRPEKAREMAAALETAADTIGPN